MNTANRQPNKKVRTARQWGIMLKIYFSHNIYHWKSLDIASILGQKYTHVDGVAILAGKGQLKLMGTDCQSRVCSERSLSEN